MIFNLFDTGADPIAAVNYRPTPSLVLYKEQQNGQSTTAWTDVVNNQRRAYRLEKGKIVGDSVSLLTTGVWETATKDAVLDESKGTLENVFTLFNAANEQNIPHRLFNCHGFREIGKDEDSSRRTATSAG